MFLSYGGFAPTGGYNMRIFSSDKITGPCSILITQSCRRVYFNNINTTRPWTITHPEISFIVICNTWVNSMCPISFIPCCCFTCSFTIFTCILSLAVPGWQIFGNASSGYPQGTYSEGAGNTTGTTGSRLMSYYKWSFLNPSAFNCIVSSCTQFTLLIE